MKVRMGRKRKIPIINEEKENEDGEECADDISSVTSNVTGMHGPMYTIMSNVQRSQTFHKRYIKEMKQLYGQMDHDAFLFTFIKMIKVAMQADETNEYAHTTLLFCATFVTSFEGEDTHILLLDTCKWLLSTISYNPHIRLRLCQFVNMILNALGQEAALDDTICDRIMEYMLAQLRDVAPSVRVQAILAMHRLQMPDNPDDPVVRAYQFHLCSDPSPRVRQTVITCLGRNHNTIPYVLERLWDIDEKVRRHTYLHMSSYPVRSYKVRQRIMLIEQGLNDRTESVRKVVVNILLEQWIVSYCGNLIHLIAALKLDANENELDRFRKAGKQMLMEIFKRKPIDELTTLLPQHEDETEEFYRCIPHQSLNIEVAFYWQCLCEYLQSIEAEEVDAILPELSKFCAYIERYCQSIATLTDPFEIMESQFILLSLLEIAHTFDLGDETGRENLQKLLTNILKTARLNERVIKVIVKCIEGLIPEQNARQQFFAEIVQEVCCLTAKQNPLVHDRALINELLSKSSDNSLSLKITSLKLRILDLEEQETDCLQRKDYEHANKYTEEKNIVVEEYTKLLQPLVEQHTDAATLSVLSKEGKMEITIKGLQIIYYMVVSKKVNSLNHSASKLYNDFICRNIASNNISARDWALKCGTAYSMLYEANAKEVFTELYTQFFKNHNLRLWETSINCIFDLLDRYDVDKFSMQDKQKSKKTLVGSRQLYNTMEALDMEDDPASTGSSVGQGVDVVYLMSHFLDTCQDVCIVKSIVCGFCRLVLRGHIKNSDILEKLLLRYFNPATECEINQLLGVFLEQLFQQRKHHLLEPCLIPTVNAVISAAYDSPLREIRPETITRFMVDATMPESCVNGEAIHNRLARAFLQEMLNNVSNKELCRILAKEIVTLRTNIGVQAELKEEMKLSISKLLESELEPRTAKYLIEFRDKLDGIINNSRQKSTTNNESNDEDEEFVTEEVVARVSESVTSENDANSNIEIPTLPPIPPLEHASPPGKDIQNTSSASTTYGRENKEQHRNLRKSMNAHDLVANKSIGSNNNDVTTTTPSATTTKTNQKTTETPKHTAKIRIEARIDSDSPNNDATTSLRRTPVKRAATDYTNDDVSTPIRRTTNTTTDNARTPTSNVTLRRTSRRNLEKDKNKTFNNADTPTRTTNTRRNAIIEESVSMLGFIIFPIIYNFYYWL